MLPAPAQSIDLGGQRVPFDTEVRPWAQVSLVRVLHYYGDQDGIRWGVVSMFDRGNPLIRHFQWDKFSHGISLWRASNTVECEPDEDPHHMIAVLDTLRGCP